jgi:hypothetical protein
MDRPQLITRIQTRWQEFQRAYAGLAASDMTRSGVVGDWSVKDIIGHVATWEEESLKWLPIVAQGLPTQRYGDIHRFNAEQVAAKRNLSLAEVLRQADETHRRLIAYVEGVPEEWFAADTRFRRRLRLDTYGHYVEHTRATCAWRAEHGL